MEKKTTIDDLLEALENNVKEINLENTEETWSRIGGRDKFSELGMTDSELDSFLKDWIENNPYSNI
jgi:NH3-dependent NAD+ synthetase